MKRIVFILALALAGCSGSGIKPSDWCPAKSHAPDSPKHDGAPDILEPKRHD